MFLCVIFVLGLQYACGAEPIKAESPFEVCPFNVSDISVPGNLEELQEFCQKMNDYYTCYEKRESEFKKPMQAGYPMLLSNSIFAVEQLCRKDSFLHKGYILYAGCYKNTAKYFQYISERQDIIAAKITSLYKHTTPQDKFLKPRDLENCVKGLQKLELLKTYITDKCGKDATVIFQTILDNAEFQTLYCLQSDLEKTRNVIRKVLTAILSKKIPISEAIVDLKDKKSELYRSKPPEVYILTDTQSE